MWYAIAASVGTLIGCRLAYGSWPWDTPKTWRFTKSEIKYLRDAQWQAHNYGVAADPGWPHAERYEDPPEHYEGRDAI